MTRMFRNVKVHEQNLKKLLESTDCGVTIEDYQYGQATPIIDMACRMVRYTSGDMERFRKLLSQHIENSVLTKCFEGAMPLMVLDKEPGQVRVFTNIFVDQFNGNMAAECTRFTYADRLLKSFIDSVTADVNDEKRKQAWLGASGRAWRRMKRYEVIPMARVLARHLKLEWPDHKIRNTAAAIEEDLRPLTLIYADTPQDFHEMYGSGPTSCMDYRHYGSWKVLSDVNSHPCAFFAYWQHTRGVYARRAGKVFARTILYEYAKDDWRYGRVYGNHEQDTDTFIACLKENGYKPLDGKYNEAERKYRHGFYKGAPEGQETSTFEIPGYGRDKHGYAFAPLPYFDNLGRAPSGEHFGYVQMEYDADRNVFIVTVGPKNKVNANVSLSNQSGTIASTKLRNVACHSCGGGMEEPRFTHQVRGVHYCSTGCMERDGAVMAHRDDGQAVVIDRANAVQDPLNNRQFWTNEMAAVRRGALELSPTLFTSNEYPEYSLHGAVLVFSDGRKIMADRNTVDEAYPHCKSSGSGRLKDYVKITRLDHTKFNIHEQKNVELDPDRPIFVVHGDIPEIVIPEEKVTKAKERMVDVVYEGTTEFDVGAGISIKFGDTSTHDKNIRVA